MFQTGNLVDPDYSDNGVQDRHFVRKHIFVRRERCCIPADDDDDVRVLEVFSVLIIV